MPQTLSSNPVPPASTRRRRDRDTPAAASGSAAASSSTASSSSTGGASGSGRFGTQTLAAALPNTGQRPRAAADRLIQRNLANFAVNIKGLLEAQNHYNHIASVLDKLAATGNGLGPTKTAERLIQPLTDILDAAEALADSDREPWMSDKAMSQCFQNLARHMHRVAHEKVAIVHDQEVQDSLRRQEQQTTDCDDSPQELANHIQEQVGYARKNLAAVDGLNGIQALLDRFALRFPKDAAECKSKLQPARHSVNIAMSAVSNAAGAVLSLHLAHAQEATQLCAYCMQLIRLVSHVRPLIQSLDEVFTQHNIDPALLDQSAVLRQGLLAFSEEALDLAVTLVNPGDEADLPSYIGPDVLRALRDSCLAMVDSTNALLAELPDSRRGANDRASETATINSLRASLASLVHEGEQGADVQASTSGAPLQDLSPADSEAGPEADEALASALVRAKPGRRPVAGEAGGTQPSRAMRLAERSLQQSLRTEAGIWLDEPARHSPDTLIHQCGQLRQKWQPRAEAMAATVASLQQELAQEKPGSGRHRRCAKTLENLQVRLKETEDVLAALPGPQSRRDLIKGFARPQASHWLHLLEAGQVDVGGVRELPVGADAAQGLYEVALRPKPGTDGTGYPPVWLHVHTAQRVAPAALAQTIATDATSLVTAHLKSDAQRNQGANYAQAQAAQGNYTFYVHRGPVAKDQLSAFLTAAAP